jgi:hypothetical protein
VGVGDVFYHGWAKWFPSQCSFKNYDMNLLQWNGILLIGPHRRHV